MSLKDEFKDEAYRRAYAESLANTIIATQIRLLRGQMTQTEFGELVGLKQSRVSAMEDENYSAWSTRTLRRIAAAKDVVYIGRFVSFGEMLDMSRRLSKDDLTVPSYAEEEHDNAAPSAPGLITARTTSESAGGYRCATGKVLYFNRSNDSFTRSISDSADDDSVEYTAAMG
jgi:hypothetical protein